MTFRLSKVRLMSQVIAFVVAASSASAQAQSQAVTAFVNVNVVSMGREGVDTDRTVIVQGDRIVAINQSPPPEGAVILDGRGRFLLPGLTDSHVHLTTDMPWAPARADFGEARLYLAHGVTTVVNLRGTPTQLDWKRRIESGQLLGPTIYTSGDFVNEPRVNSPDEVEREVRAQAKAGYDLIKFHEIRAPGEGFSTTRGLSRESYLRMFDAARQENIGVVGHAPISLGVSGLVASSGGAVAHIGELIRLQLLPPFWLLQGYIAAFAVLLLIVGGWAISAVVRRWRGASLASKSLLRAKVLASLVLVGFVASFVVGSLVGAGGRFYDDSGWRVAATLVYLAVVLICILAIVASIKVWRDSTVRVASRFSLIVAATVSMALIFTVTFYSIPSSWKNTDAGRTRLAVQLRAAGLSVQTTLIVYETALASREASARVLSDPAFAALLPQTQALWRRLAERPPPGLLAGFLDMPPRYSEYTRTIAASLHRNGVQLLAGTDAMGLPMVLPGRSLLRELQLINESGLSPYEVLRTATVNVAKFLGKEKEFGTIAVGRRADLILLSGNPLEDLGTLNEPLGVMVRGTWLPRDRLRDLVAQLR